MNLVNLRLPDGSTTSLPAPGPGEKQSLARWLAGRDLPLNMRCGGRGICRGCEVEMKSPAGPRTIKACQVPSDIFTTKRIEQLSIPPASLADHSLSGVRAFEVCLPRDVAPRQKEGLGLALDVGTTTLAAALWEFAPTGSTPSAICLGTTSSGNPQRRFGDNVLSRISYSLEHPQGLTDLRVSLLQEGVLPLVKAICHQAGRHAAEIRCVEVAGNPTMLQTLTGDSLEGLARFPFSTAWSGDRLLPASFFDGATSGAWHFLPSLGPFVGADIVAGVLASGMLDDERTTLLIDFGTNGEIFLRHEGKCWATATAAGPAFEGGRLRCGAAAHAGAVSAMDLQPDGHWLLLGGEGEPLVHPTTISGAAYIDFVAIGLETGLLNSFGRFDGEHPLWKAHGRREEDDLCLDLGGQLFITEADVAELLQAKAAIGAGVRVLLELAGIAPHHLERVVVAGGFGYHLRIDRACRIGLLPLLPRELFAVVGNSSLAGASLALQFDLTENITALSSKCRVIELNQMPSFSDYYTDNLLLEPFPEL